MYYILHTFRDYGQNVIIGLLIINQSINRAAGDAPHVNRKKRIAGADTVYD